MLLVAVHLTGCGDSYGGRLAVRGTVTLDGQLLKDGSIVFVPLDGQGTQSGAMIQNGGYTVPRKSGLKPGKYLIQITSGDGITPATAEENEVAAPGGSTNIVSRDRIPAEWNVRSEQKIEVKAEGSNKFDFDIPGGSSAKKR
jgi:hypothetical protein